MSLQSARSALSGCSGGCLACRHHDTMFITDKSPEELADLAAGLGTSQAAMQRRSRHLCAQESRLFEAMKPGLQGAARLLGGQAREKLESDIILMKVALRDCPLNTFLLDPADGTWHERMAPGIQQHPEWPEYCQSVQEIAAAVRDRHLRIMASSSFGLH